MTTDLHGNDIHVGDRVRAWKWGAPFIARITHIEAGAGHVQDTDLLTLVRDDAEVVERDSDAVQLTQPAA